VKDNFKNDADFLFFYYFKFLFKSLIDLTNYWISKNS